MGIAGGTMYNYLIAQCALKSRAGAIFTWNVKHYRRFGPEVVEKLKVPVSAL